MVLSNVEIVRALAASEFEIHGLAGTDPAQKPFNTSAVDLRLGTEVQVPKPKYPVQLDLRKLHIARFLQDTSERFVLTEEQPFVLKHGELVLANTLETVNFPIGGRRCFGARVEGKSSLARCGILVHFTAPTIHAGFRGTITLEIINLGPYEFLLYPGMFVCQLIVEEVLGNPADAPNQFAGQTHPAGVV
jgi:dCTP deaminase